MDGFSLAGAAAVGTLTAAYLYFGGRFSIALVVLVGYGIYCNETDGRVEAKVSLKAEKQKSCCSNKKTAEGGKTGGCCSDKRKNGGGGGGCCSSKGGKKKSGGGCCSSKNGKKGGCCSSKKKISNDENVDPVVEEAKNFPMTVDFTDVFKKPTKKRSSTPKIFSKNDPSKSKAGKN